MASDLQPRVVAKVDRIEPVLEAGAKIGFMLVDKHGVNCIRHERDSFPLIMDRANADRLFAACQREGAARAPGQRRR